MLAEEEGICHNADMVKIVLASDSHGEREPLRKLREMYADYDMFVHCGDSELAIEDMEGWICVLGNNDFLYGNSVPYNRVIEADGHKIYVCHGHMDFLSYFHYKPMAKRAKDLGCDLVFFGHVHQVSDTMEEGVRLLNPGSLRHNRDLMDPSYMLVTIDGDRVSVETKTYGTPRKKGWVDKLIEWLMKL